MASIRRLATAVVLIVSLMAGFAAIASGASAAGEPPPVTDYANYPDRLGFFADGCTARGTALLEGEQFTVDGVTSSGLASFDLEPGAIIDMTWTGVAPGCDDTAISLSVKRADGPTWDPKDDQELVPGYDICGGGGTACDGSLSLTMPDDLCNWQVDAALGPPLSVVGPNGSYYNSNTRVANGKPAGSDMLISANNGGTDCTPPGEPEATAEVDCAEGGVVVTITNPTNDTIQVEVNGDTVDVPPSGTEHVVPVAEGETVKVIVTFEGTAIFDEDFTRDCAPDVAAAIDCAKGGVVVTLTNTSPDHPMDVTVNGEAVTVPPGPPVEKVVPVAEDATVTVTVTSGGEQIFEDEFARDCEHPGANPKAEVKPACSTGGFDVVLSNTGAAEAPFKLVVDGEAQFEGTIEGGGSKTVHVDAAEDTTHQVTATSGSTSLHDAGFTVDCEQPLPRTPGSGSGSGAGDRVLGTQITRSGETTIPATGSTTTPLLQLAAVLIGLGTAFVLAPRARRRVANRVANP